MYQQPFIILQSCIFLYEILVRQIITRSRIESGYDDSKYDPNRDGIGFKYAKARHARVYLG